MRRVGRGLVVFAANKVRIIQSFMHRDAIDDLKIESNLDLQTTRRGNVPR